MRESGYAQAERSIDLLRQTGVNFSTRNRRIEDWKVLNKAERRSTFYG